MIDRFINRLDDIVEAIMYVIYWPTWPRRCFFLTFPISVPIWGSILFVLSCFAITVMFLKWLWEVW